MCVCSDFECGEWHGKVMFCVESKVRQETFEREKRNLHAMETACNVCVLESKQESLEREKATRHSSRIWVLFFCEGFLSVHPTCNTKLDTLVHASSVLVGGGEVD